MSYLNQYLSQVSNALGRNNVQALKDLLRVDNGGALQAVSQQLRPNQIHSACQKLQPPWQNVIDSHLQALAHAHAGRYESAFVEYTKPDGPGFAVGDELKHNPEDALAALAFEQVVTNAYRLAEMADEQLEHAGKGAGKLEAVGSFLQSLMSRLGPPKGSGAQEGKRRGYLVLVCALMKVYFKLNNIGSCSQLNRTVQKTFGDDNLQGFPASYRVTFLYYLGRTQLYNEDIASAVMNLMRAFQDCLPAAVANRQKILRYLVPIKMLVGELPSDELLQQYSLLEYADIKKAVQHGDVGLLNRCLEDNQFRFVKAGTYLLLEKLQFACYRRLLKKCYVVNRELRHNDKTSHQVPLGLLQKSLKEQGINLDMDELECIVANMIMRLYIKGYVAHKAKVVVLSKDNGFPPPSDKWWKDTI
eukprot:jgi/Chrzof1/2504/Cz11g18030.t1